MNNKAIQPKFTHLANLYLVIVNDGKDDPILIKNFEKFDPDRDLQSECLQISLTDIAQKVAFTLTPNDHFHPTARCFPMSEADMDKYIETGFLPSNEISMYIDFLRENFPNASLRCLENLYEGIVPTPLN